jgi:hypothetical protein
VHNLAHGQARERKREEELLLSARAVADRHCFYELDAAVVYIHGSYAKGSS